VLGVQEVWGAPAADASGNVFFVTDSGYLYKLDSDLVEQWRVLPGNSRRLYGPVIGSGGVVFCGDDEGKVYAYKPDGTKEWTKTLTGVRETYMVVGNQYLFAACDNGHVYALDPGTGSEVWDKRVSTEGEFEVYPMLTRNGCIYVLDDNIKLFCIEQATGSKLWDIACTDYYPGQPGTDGVGDPKPSPALLPNGNIIIAGGHALYFVSGYADGTLDTGAPWPKWQHDLHNTGHWPGW
jgi:outer membrane protein assembly factor BamB